MRQRRSPPPSPGASRRAGRWPWFLLLHALLTLGQPAFAAPAPPRFSVVRSVSTDVLQLAWTTEADHPTTLLVSSDLAQWIPMVTLPHNGGTTALALPVSPPSSGPQFYRLARLSPLSTLRLATNQASPGQWLRISGNSFQVGTPTWVGFLDAEGHETRVRTTALATNLVDVLVPPLLQANSSPFSAGPARLNVLQQSAPDQPLRLFDAVVPLALAEPLPTLLPPATLTLAWLDRLSAMITRNAATWERIAQASGGSVDTRPWVLELRALAAQLETTRAVVQNIAQHKTSRHPLGRLNGREVVLDLAGVETLDRLLAAHLVGIRLSASANASLPESIAPFARTGLASRSTDVDPLTALGQFFDAAEAPDSRLILESFNQVSALGSVGIGIVATTAVVLGTASAPAAAVAAGTAGAVLFFTTCVAPAIMAASSQALAAPFLEVQAGRPIPSLDDYRPALDHLQKGCRAHLTDELVGRVVKGTFIALNADKTLASFFELYVNTSRSMLNLQDLARPDSVGSQTFAQAPRIFAALAPPGGTTPGTYIGTFTGTLTESTPSAGWRHDLTGTLTLAVRGQGTIPDPYQGTLQLSAQDRITLTYCHEPVGCEPGGTVTIQTSDGDLYGDHGTLEGEGIGGVDDAPLHVEFTGGVFRSGHLEGTLQVDLGVDQTLTAAITLTRLP